MPQFFHALTHRYQRSEVFQLFFWVALPIHIWSFYIFTYNFDWTQNWTNTWNAIGYGGYAMMTAFFESLILTALCLALGYLLPWSSWRGDKVVAALGSVFLIVILVSMGVQLYAEFGEGSPFWAAWLANLSSPASLWGVLNGGVGLFFALLAGGGLLAAQRSEKYVKVFMAIVDRISLLAILYLLLDVIGIGLVVYRNWIA